MIETTRSGSVAVMRLAHGKAHAFDTALMRGVRQALARAAESDARALVLTGTGTIFSAGVDLKRLIEGGTAYVEEFLPALTACLRELFAFPKPAVAAVNGHAIAGGCLLACACDHRIMVRGESRIGVPELRVGVPFPLVALDILRYAVPPHAAHEAAILGGTFLPEDALARGIVDEVVEPERLLPRAIEVAEALAAVPPGSFRRTKLDLRRPTLESWARLGSANDLEMIEAWSSREVMDAVRAYVQRTLGEARPARG